MQWLTFGASAAERNGRSGPPLAGRSSARSLPRPSPSEGPQMVSLASPFFIKLFSRVETEESLDALPVVRGSSQWTPDRRIYLFYIPVTR